MTQHISEISAFSNKLLAWFDVHGRKTLPWQKPINHYRVWISEIMLQQTQVATVITYFNAFMERFPTIESLAKAPVDEVMHAWAGLGYYSRARNLHQSAIMIMKEFQGTFPKNLESLMRLPGIGKSTAGAILSIVDQKPFAILDGNVRRVLARHFRIEGSTEQPKIQKKLWTLAEKLVSHERPHHYTQAIMDLGATVCIPKKPQCTVCPLQKTCQAHQHNETHLFPHKKASLKQKERSAEFAIVVVQNDALLLHKQDQKGVWNGLWVPPNTLLREELWLKLFEEHLDPSGTEIKLKPFTHVFTHFKLKIIPSIFYLKEPPKGLDFDLKTVKLSILNQYALPAPFEKLLTHLFQDTLYASSDGFLRLT